MEVMESGEHSASAVRHVDGVRRHVLASVTTRNQPMGVRNAKVQPNELVDAASRDVR